MRQQASASESIRVEQFEKIERGSQLLDRTVLMESFERGSQENMRMSLEQQANRSLLALPREIWLAVLSMVGFREVIKQVTVSWWWRAVVYQSVTVLAVEDGKRLHDEALVRFVSLRDLICWDCNQLTDNGLKRMSSLTALRLGIGSGWKLTNKGISCLTNLTTLHLKGDGAIDGDGLKGLTRITELYLSDVKQIKDGAVAQMTQLKSLELGWSTVITDKGISGLTNLVILSLRAIYPVTDNGLRGLTNLTKLRLGYQHNITMGGISSLCNLTALNLRSSGGVVGDLGIFPNLVALDLSDCLSRVRIGGLINLTSLELGANFVIGDAELQRLTNLTRLCLRYNTMITNEGVRNLTRMTDLDLSRNQTITNDGIAGMVNLTRLNLESNNSITDEGITGLTKLSTLLLKDNRLISREAVEKLPNLTNLDRQLSEHLESEWKTSLRGRASQGL